MQMHFFVYEQFLWVLRNSKGWAQSKLSISSNKKQMYSMPCAQCVKWWQLTEAQIRLFFVVSKCCGDKYFLLMFMNRNWHFRIKLKTVDCSLLDFYMTEGTTKCFAMKVFL